MLGRGRLPLAAAAAAIAAAVAAGPRIRATAPGPERFALVNARIFTVSGEVIERGTIVVQAGKIESVGAAAPPAAVRAIDVGGRVVIPGLVAAHSLAPNAPADEETIAPDLRAIDAIDVYAKNRALLEGGVTTAYVSPGSQRLVSGVGAVAKTAGRERVLRERAALQVAFGDAPKSPPSLFEPPIPPSADNPILPARPQLPSVRAATPSTLRLAFADAAQLRAELGRGPVKRDLRLEALFPALAREMPVRANVHREGDILAALDLAKDLNLRLVIEGGSEADRLSPLLATAKVPVVLEAASRPGRLLDGDPVALGPTGRERETTAATLARDGVLFALVPGEGGDLRDLLLSAGHACRYGLDEKTALRAVTLSAAEILGVADRVGSIEPGKDADLVVLSTASSPFDLAAAPFRVFVGGEPVFERKPEAGVLAVRGGRILTGTGEEIRNGVILVESGRIVDVSRFGSIPFDAEVIDAGDGVVVPGFIDMATSLGLHFESDGTGRVDANDSGPSSGKTDVALAVDGDDPAFASALREGVTTVVVMPAGRALVSGQAAAVKTGGGRDAVFRSPAALRFAATSSVLGPPASTWATKLREALKRGKDYHDRFEKYAKDLDEWEKKKDADAKAAEDAKKAAEGEKAASEEKKAPAAGEAKADEPPAKRESAPVDPITGHWEGTIAGGPIPQPVPFSADLRHETGAVTGTLTSAMQGTVPITSGSFDGTTLKLAVGTPMGSLEITATLEEKDKLSGTWNLAGQASGTLECSRTSAPEGAPVAAAAPAARKPADGKPEEPKKDPDLEPFRALFRKEIPAVVEARQSDEIEAALAVFKDEFGLDAVLLRGDESWRVAPDVARRGSGVAVGPEVVRRLPERDVNLPRLLSRAGVPIGFASLSARGAAELPLTAAYAVRYGLASGEALKGLTSGAAKLLKLDSRIGSIAAGRDADFVILSGEPFEPTTRVRAVIVNGRVAFDAEGSEPW